MRAMTLRRAGERLALEDRPEPVPGPGQIRLRVEACGVCRTDLHVVDGDLPDPKLPIVPGHEIVGRVEAAGPGVALAPGARVGVPWLGHTCGHCPYCLSGRENLCDRRSSPATPATAASPPTRSPTPPTPSRSPRISTRSPPRRCSARA